MYTANFEVIEQEDPSKILIMDTSTGTETPNVRTITLYKTDLVPVVYTFPSNVKQILIEGLTQDFVFNGKFNATNGGITNSTYTKEHDFILLGYTKKAKLNRLIALEIDETIVDKKQFRSDSNDIIYFSEAAVTFVENGSLLDAQCCLDYIKELTGY